VCCYLDHDSHIASATAVTVHAAVQALNRCGAAMGQQRIVISRPEEDCCRILVEPAQNSN
jgi:hypothetical protein